jgi:hypothetical protein
MINIPNIQNTVLPLKPTADTGSYYNINEESNSDKDLSLDNYLYPEISTAIAFIKDGIPMQKFQAEIYRFILNTAWEYNILQGSISLPPLLPNIVDNI